jgi:hypothetical protein
MSSGAAFTKQSEMTKLFNSVVMRAKFCTRPLKITPEQEKYFNAVEAFFVLGVPALLAGKGWEVVKAALELVGLFDEARKVSQSTGDLQALANKVAELFHVNHRAIEIEVDWNGSPRKFLIHITPQESEKTIVQPLETADGVIWEDKTSLAVKGRKTVDGCMKAAGTDRYKLLSNNCQHVTKRIRDYLEG